MNQQRTILGACDYSIASLENIKAALLDFGNPHKDVNWAMGSVIVMLSSHLLRLCHETFLESAQNDESNAVQDIKTIKGKFNEFIEGMIHND